METIGLGGMKVIGVPLSGGSGGSSSGSGGYAPPEGGIPATDLSDDVQTSLGKADSALQEHQSIKTLNGESLVGSGNVVLVDPEVATALTIDNVPTIGSTALVKSGGTREYIDVNTQNISEIELLNIDETVTGDLQAQSTIQVVSIPFQFYKGVNYDVTLSSNTPTVKFYISEPVQTSQKSKDLSVSSYTYNITPSKYFNLLKVTFTGGISTAGTLTAKITSTSYRNIGTNTATKKIGRNLCNPVKCRTNEYITSNGIIPGGTHKVTDWIPIKAGQTLICNAKASSSVYRINGLFANYGDTFPISTTTYTSYAKSYSSIYNVTWNEDYSVFNVPKNTDIMICEGTIPHAYVPYNEVGGYTEDLRDFSSWGSIGANYPSEVADELSILSQLSGIKFVHITDTHGDGVAKFAYDFASASSADFLVHTGDIVNDAFSDNFSGTLSLALSCTKPTYMVIGNHDAYHSGTTQAVFEKFIEPLNEHNNLTNNTTTYYSVDFSAKKVKCIFMNDYDGEESSSHNMGYYTVGNITDNQITWFISELKLALTNNYSVAIFIHQSPDDAEDFVENWYDTVSSEKAANTTFIAEIVNAFMERTALSVTNPATNTAFTDTFSGIGSANGRFAGYFCGHTHVELAGKIKDYPKQNVNILSMPNIQKGYDGVFRTPTVELANYVVIDGVNHWVQIYRLGSQITKCAGERKSRQYRF